MSMSSSRTSSSEAEQVHVPHDLDRKRFWVKVVGMLQQNWAVVRVDEESGHVQIWFINDHLDAFDFIDCADRVGACEALKANGFRVFSFKSHSGLDSPIPALLKRKERFGVRWVPRRIYSSGEYWEEPV